MKAFPNHSHFFEWESAEFPQALKARIAEALWRTCLARAEETDDRREAPGSGLSRIPRKKSTRARAGRPFRRSPQTRCCGAVGFPTRPRKISSGPESDSALRQGLPGGTAEVSSSGRGLVSPKARATEPAFAEAELRLRAGRRRKAWGNSGALFLQRG